MTNPLVLIASSLRLQQIALQPLSNFSSHHFSISEYRRQLDHMGLKAAAMKKLILVYRYVQTSPCCIYCLVNQGVLIDENRTESDFIPVIFTSKKEPNVSLLRGIVNINLSISLLPPRCIGSGTLR